MNSRRTAPADITAAAIDGVESEWFSVENTIVLVPADEPGEPVDPGRTA